jgi:hypothetical protein
MNDVETFIAVAEDCPVTRGTIPEPRGGKRPVALIQYELLAHSPYTYTQEDVLFESFLRHKGLQPAPGDGLREAFFSKPQACLRASPLPKKYGWGLHFDSEGRVALCAMESEPYQRLASGSARGVKVLKALRSARG